MPALRIDLIDGTDVAKAFRLHEDYVQAHQARSYLWPRDVAFFKERAHEGSLYGVFEGADLLAHCYINFDKESPHVREFGGVQAVRPGISSTLSRVCIAANVVEAELQVDEALIAHVHEANLDPIKLLPAVGFRHVGWEVIPDDIAPPQMPRSTHPNVSGVRGRLYKYDPARFVELGAKIKAMTDFEIALAFWDPDAVARALVELSQKLPALVEPALQEAT